MSHPRAIIPDRPVRGTLAIIPNLEHMTYDLRTELWIPWRRRSGVVEWGPPATLLTRLADDPVVALAAPRPDFDGALQEFLIGLLSAALRPADEAEWKAIWKSPPSPAELQAALDVLPDAFDLDGDGPRFFQDLNAAEFAEVVPGPIEQILIEAPGDQTQKLNKDLFIKRARLTRLSRPAAAMALLTLQTYAPSGGQGHRTSLRGGGPLSTLVDPRVDQSGAWLAHEQPLWQKLWANAETLGQCAARTPPRYGHTVESAFPWLLPTRTSGKGAEGPTTPSHAHALQAYFGMPRRIRLEFAGPGWCDLTGVEDERTVVGFRMRNYGVQYTDWKHPLSPYYRQKVSEPWLCVHGQPGGIAWRDWISLTLRAPDAGLREPAQAVAAFQRRANAVGRRNVRLHAFGYDMDNMKACAWTDAVLPAFAVGDEGRHRLLYQTAAALTDATGMTGTALTGAVKAGLFQSPDDAPGDLGQVKLDLWASTERAFYGVLEAVADPSLEEDAAVNVAAEERRRRFLEVLTGESTRVFDRWCSAGALAPEALRRRVVARYNLLSTLRGYSKLGQKIFEALGIAPPDRGRATRRGKSCITTEATT